MKRLFLLLFGFASLTAAQNPFSSDSALSYLRTLAVEIGPRPTGSPNEHRAMEFALSKFREFGLQEAYILPMKFFVSETTKRGKNTNSGTAVGVLKGKTDRIIVIGGHIDSAGPDIPGANDDGSGAATVIELARILSQKPHESTIVFCLFGGEELGVRGSTHFVKNFPQLSKVAMMLQVDMANGADWLLPMFDQHTYSAPKWLVRAAYEEFGKLPHSGLYYPLHFYTLNYAFGHSGAGSDHDPFLEKGIPAIDFTSDPNDPIHTPQDNFENFKPAGLKRTGDLVYNLMQRFDGGVPPEKTDRYAFVQVGSMYFFVPPFALIALIVLAIGVAVWALFDLGGRRVEPDKASRPKWPRAKLFLLMLIIQICVWLSENVVGLVKGNRFPWLADSGGYFVLGFIAALVGIWLSLQLSPKLKLSRDPFRYYIGAAIILAIFLLIFALTTTRMMTYPAIGLLLLSAAMLVRNPLLKFVLWIASPHFMYRLIFNEAWGLFSHSMIGFPPSVGMSIALHAVYVVFFSVWSFPFLLGFAAIYFDSSVDLLWLKKFRKPIGIAVTAGAFIVCTIVLAMKPTFTAEWKQHITIDQSYDQTKGSGTLAVHSTEYLNGSDIRFHGHDSSITSRTTEINLGTLTPPPANWILAHRSVSATRHDSTTSWDIMLSLAMPYRPYTLNVTYSASKSNIDSASSPLTVASGGRSVSLSWYSFPDSTLMIPLHFVTTAADSITETVEAVFMEQMEPVSVSNPHASVASRTTVRMSTPLHQ